MTITVFPVRNQTIAGSLAMHIDVPGMLSTLYLA